jgi:hypothetical protein
MQIPVVVHVNLSHSQLDWLTAPFLLALPSHAITIQYHPYNMCQLTLTIMDGMEMHETHFFRFHFISFFLFTCSTIYQISVSSYRTLKATEEEEGYTSCIF